MEIAKFKKHSTESSTLFKIEDSDEPEGVIRFSSGIEFYYSLNPMTKYWDLDHLEEFLTEGVDLIEAGDGKETVKYILSKI